MIFIHRCTSNQLATSRISKPEHRGDREGMREVKIERRGTMEVKEKGGAGGIKGILRERERLQ